MSDLGIVLLIIALIALYFLPTIIAMRRRHANRWPIFAINLLFGGSGLGWIGALIWSLHGVHRSQAGWTGGESGLNIVGNDKGLVDSGAHNSVQNADHETLRDLRRLLDAGALEVDEYERLKRPIIGRLAARLD